MSISRPDSSSLFVAALVAVVLAVLPACGSDGSSDNNTSDQQAATCQEACGNTFDQCPEAGQGLTMDQCTQLCEANSSQSAINCAASATSCSAVQSCNQQSQSNSTPDAGGTEDTNNGGETTPFVASCNNNPNVGPDSDCPHGECSEALAESEGTECDMYDGFENADDSTLCAGGADADYYLGIQQGERFDTSTKYYYLVHCTDGSATTEQCSSGVGTSGTGDPYSCE